MPVAAPHLCNRCRRNLTHQRYCESCQPKALADDVAFRGTATERGYGAEWRALRARYARAHPWCEDCLATDPANQVPVHEVHHVIEHRGSRALLLAWGNLRSLCAHHHALTKRSGSGYRARVRP